MKSSRTYTIPFIGLKLGTHQYDYHIDKSFFDVYPQQDFNSTDIDVKLNFTKKTTLLELDFDISGYVNINCDVTNESYNQKVSNVFSIVVKFGQDFDDTNEDLLILPHGAYEVNIQQYIYEFIVLSVPYKRVHPDVLNGTSTSIILDKLNSLEPNINKEEDSTDSDHGADDDPTDTDPRWDALKKLL